MVAAVHLNKSFIPQDVALIPHVNLSTEEKLETEAVMRRGALVINKAIQKIKQGKRIHFSRERFRTMFFEEIRKNGVKSMKIEGVKLSLSDVTSIMDIKNIEWKVLCGVGRLIYKRALAWSIKKLDCDLHFFDFYNEATIAAMNAIYGFHKNVRFITYCQYAIENRMLNSANAYKPLSRWSDDSKKLYVKYVKTKAEINDNATFEDIVTVMDISKDEVQLLRSLLRTVSNSSDLQDNSETRSDLMNKIPEKKVVNDSLSIDGLNINQLLSTIEMNDLERAVVDAYLSGDKGWAAHVANSHINPVTRKRYTTRATRDALERVIKSLRKRHANAA